MNPSLPISALTLALLTAAGCTQRASIQFITLPSQADADLTIVGEPAASSLPKASVEIRNTGDWIADLKIEEAPGWGTMPTPRSLTPALPLPPGGVWKTEIDQGLLLRIHNATDRDVKLQLFTPFWSTLSLAVYPNGRDNAARREIVNEPGADGVFREPPRRDVAGTP